MTENNKEMDKVMLEYIRLLIETYIGACNMTDEELIRSCLTGTILQLLELQGINFDNIASQGYKI